MVGKDLENIIKNMKLKSALLHTFSIESKEDLSESEYSNIYTKLLDMNNFDQFDDFIIDCIINDLKLKMPYDKINDSDLTSIMETNFLDLENNLMLISENQFPKITELHFSDNPKVIKKCAIIGIVPNDIIVFLDSDNYLIDVSFEIVSKSKMNCKLALINISKQTKVNDNSRLYMLFEE